MQNYISNANGFKIYNIVFFLLICILMGKGLNKLGEFNYIYQSLNIF